MSLRLKRVYEPAAPDDGRRFLVDRLWPRGVTKEDARLAGWLKELAPSVELRKWFGHDPSRWDEFRGRYAAELQTPEKQELLGDLARQAEKTEVTLVYGARDEQHNGALVLRDAIEKRESDPPPSEEWLYRTIVTESQDGIIFADRRGVIRLWNAGAETIFGYSASEALGQTLDLIVPERQRQRHWEGYDRVMETGETRYGRELLAVPATRRDGTRISIEFTIVLAKDEGGQVVGAAATIRDVTARWQEQRELRQTLADLQAKVDAQTSESGARPS